MADINKLLNANLYVDGNNMIGRADEITLPTVTAMMADHKPLGQVGTTQYASGFEAMEATIKLNGPYPDLMKKASNPFKALDIQARGVIDVYSGGDRTAQQAYVVYLRGRSKSLPLGAIKAQENAEFEMSLACSYVKLEINGSVVMEFDPENNIHIVDGVDTMSEYRALLGL